MNKILFDANSTDPVSSVIAVAPGDCVLINGWNFGPGETATVFRLAIETGSMPAQQGGSCEPTLPITPAQIIEEDPYEPCNTPVQVGQTATQNISSLVLSQPGFYNVHLTPAALGTAYVEAQTLTGAEACAQAAAACCCTPQQNWAGSSASPCLSITPGGTNNMAPVFDLDPCCVLQQIANPVVPNVADSIIVLQGGACGRATLQDVIDLVMVCGTLGGFPLQAFTPGDTLVALDNGANCKRLDAETMVTALETPWTGTSLTPALTITPGGVNGHAPVFEYNLCDDLQTFASCACEPNPGDLVPILQDVEGDLQCVLATWPTVDLCAQIGVLANGALVVGDTIPVREAGGACKQVLASSIAAGFDGGTINNPILGPDGSCAAPTYSFTSAPDSGMFYDAGLGAVIIGDANCGDFIQIGVSVVAQSAPSGPNFGASLTLASATPVIGGVITLQGGDNAGGGSAGSLFLLGGDHIAGGQAANIELHAGNSLLAGGSGGNIVIDAGQGALNQGAVLIAGSGNTIAMSNVGVQITLTPAGEFILGPGFPERLRVTALGEWRLQGVGGVAGQVFTSNGPGLPPTWQAAGGGGVVEPNTQLVYGTGAGVDSSPFGFYNIATGAFSINENTGPTRLSLAAPGDVNLVAATHTAGVGRSITLAAGDSTADNGGQVFINGGETSESVFLNRRGGNVNIRGGQPAGGFQHGGGHVLIHGGNASLASQFGGDVIINYGTEGITATQNSSTIFLGRAGGGGGDGGLNIPANPNQLTTLRGTNGRPWAQTGSTLVLQGGQADNSGGPNNGGDVRLLTGEQFAGGVKGRIDLFADQGAFDSPIAHFTGSGDAVMAGYGQGTNGTQNTALLVGATSGFLWPPRIAGAPTGVPAGTNIPGGTVYANPMVVRETGGTIVLHIYEFGTATWRSVALT